MSDIGMIQAIHKTGRLVFTTREIAAIRGSSISSNTQCLSRLEKQHIITKILQSVWAVTSDKRFSPYLVVPYLAVNHRSYISFISALHIYGVISQIPQVITVASTAHSKKMKTPVGTYFIHQISPDFFDGFDWNSGGDYLIASPEKALVDCLYLASRKGKQYAHFPELDLENISRKKTMEWVKRIKDARVRRSVTTMAQKIFAK
jgi:predicted transcriptional regulator of viral defense system